MSRGNPFLALRLPHSTMAALRAAANDQGLGVSDVVRAALAAGLLPQADKAVADAAPMRDADSSKKERRAPRPPSRPQRLRRLAKDLQELIDEYQDWYESQPEALRETPTGEVLQEAIDGLADALDRLDSVTLPRGFGRD